MCSTKDKVLLLLKSFAMYKFVFASRNACYVGKSTRHLPSSINQRLKIDKKSHIYQHLSTNENCFNSFIDGCFPILNTVQRKKSSIKDFFSKCDQIRRKLRIWSHLLKKSLMENFIFCAVELTSFKCQTKIRKALYIKGLDLILNKQKKTLNITIWVCVGILLFLNYHFFHYIFR